MDTPLARDLRRTPWPPQPGCAVPLLV